MRDGWGVSASQRQAGTRPHVDTECRTPKDSGTAPSTLWFPDPLPQMKGSIYFLSTAVVNPSGAECVRIVHVQWWPSTSRIRGWAACSTDTTCSETGVIRDSTPCEHTLSAILLLLPLHACSGCHWMYMWMRVLETSSRTTTGASRSPTPLTRR